MALPIDRGDREYVKFCELPNSGLTAVRICAEETDPIPVFDATPGDELNVNTYGEISSVASSTLTTIVSYTVPIGKTFFLQHVQVSGENIATYSTIVGGSTEAKVRTWFNGSGLAETMDFPSNDNRGLSVSAGTLIEVKVIHERPSSGDFEARIWGNLKG